MTACSDLLSWLDGQGARFPGARPVEVPGMGRGLVARRRLSPGETVLFVPRRAWMTRKSAGLRHRALVDLAHGVGLFSHSMSRLALHLALEREDAASAFGPYLNGLDATTVPYSLSDAERLAAQGLSIEGWIDEQARVSAEEAQRLGAWLVEQGQSELAARLTIARWRWAYGHVLLRTFTVDDEDDEVWVLVPGMDLCNHADDPNARYFAEQDGWYLEAAATIESGQQVTIRYGTTKTSADLFLYYGFVTPDNVNDFVRLRLLLSDNDPDEAEKRAAIDLLGLTTHAKLGQDGTLPTALLHAAILWGLPSDEFRSPAPPIQDPTRAAAALLRIARACQSHLAAAPTTRMEDERLLATQALMGWLRPMVTYRRNVKALYEQIAAALVARAETIRREGWQPTERTDPVREGAYALDTMDVELPGPGPSA